MRKEEGCTESVQLDVGPTLGHPGMLFRPVHLSILLGALGQPGVGAFPLLKMIYAL